MGPSGPPKMGPLRTPPKWGSRDPEKCTFFWVFNNSPSRDRFRDGIFGTKFRVPGIWAGGESQNRVHPGQPGPARTPDRPSPRPRTRPHPHGKALAAHV